MVFSPAEQLSLFPALGQPVPDAAPWLCASRAERDAAEAGRTARPLTVRGLRAALDVVPPLGTLLALAEALRDAVGRLAVRLFAYDVFQLAVFAFLWAYGLPLFGARNLAAAQAAHVIRVAGWTLPMFTVGVRMWSLRDATGHAGEPTVDGHGYAGLARYVQLTGLDRGTSGAKDDPESSAGQAGALLEHDPADDLCPCPVCARSLLGRSRTFLLGLLAINFPLLSFAYVLAVLWTPAVTLAPSVWASAWSIGLCAVCAAMIFLLLEMQIPVASAGVRNVNTLDLELRLRHRAVTIALDDLHSRLALAASVEPESEPILPRIDEEPYVSLHGQLLSSWRTGAADFSAQNRVHLSALGTEALAAIICAAAGTCIPATYVAGAAFCLWMLALAAYGVAARNQQPERAAAQYRTVAQELLVLSASVPAGRERLRGLLAAHGGMLASFAGQEGARARFFGAHVTFGSLRGLLVGCFTVLAGLWTLLRAAGVGLTMDLACRAPS